MSSPYRLSRLRRSARAAVVTLFLAAAAPALAQGETKKFSFGPAPAEVGYTKVDPTTEYSAGTGYGFEPVTPVGQSPRYFSVALPEGNYTVTVKLGDPSTPTDTTIKAELRRLMLQGVKTNPGQFVTRTFTVNIRTPEIPGGGHVKLKPREKTDEIWNWDDKLTLEFNGPHPGVTSLDISPAPDAPTVYLLGDSTVCDQPREPWNSWGQMLPRFFKPGVAVANHAESGESLKSSLGAHRLDKVLSTIHKGDYLFVQFGHNDTKEKGDGVGAFTTYTQNLKKFVDGAQEKGATPVLVTSMERKAGVEKDTLGDYPEAVRRGARECNVPLIDLHDTSRTLYKALGPDLGKAFQDGTHHNNYGSYELARCIVEGIRQNKLDLAKFIADDLPPFDPTKPDPIDSFNVPASTMSSTTKPLGS